MIGVSGHEFVLFWLLMLGAGPIVAGVFLALRLGQRSQRR